MNPKLKTFLFFFFGALAGIAVMYVINPPKFDNAVDTEITTKDNRQNSDFNQGEKSKKGTENNNKKSSNNYSTQSIDELTKQSVVVAYLKTHQKLPDYYITKKAAKSSGWEASKGNLCDVLPGRAIGGDKFTNREKRLPTQKGRNYYEADLNYNCGRRNADRVVFSNDGLIFVTTDHYKTFQEQ